MSNRLLRVPRSNSSFTPCPATRPRPPACHDAARFFPSPFALVTSLCLCSSARFLLVCHLVRVCLSVGLRSRFLRGLSVNFRFLPVRLLYSFSRFLPLCPSISISRFLPVYLLYSTSRFLPMSINFHFSFSLGFVY